MDDPALSPPTGTPLPGTVHHASAAILAIMDGRQVQWLLDRRPSPLGDPETWPVPGLRP